MLDTFAGVAAKLAEMTGDARLRDVFHFVYMNRVDVYAQRMLDASATCYGYSADVMLKSEKGWMVMVPDLSAASALGRDQRVASPSGRGRAGIETYRIEPEAIEYGENFIVHREGPEVYAVPAECDFLEQSIHSAGRLRYSDHRAAP